jgi:hypothetical protein
VQALIGHDRHGQGGVDLGQPLDLGAGHRLLDQVDAGLGRPGQPAQRGDQVPAGVEVDSRAGLAGELLGQLGDPGDVVGGLLGVHAGPREPVRPAQRNVEDRRLDPIDRHVLHGRLPPLGDAPGRAGVAVVRPGARGQAARAASSRSSWKS